MTLTIGSVNRPCRGEEICGDTFCIVPNESTTLIAIADGLGHGPMAEEASRAFCDYATEHASENLRSIMDGATSAISRTRGAAAALIRIDEKALKLFFCGVGNIEFQAVSKNKIRPVCAPGIVGRPLRKILQFEYDIADGDLLATYSDGISSRFQLSDYCKAEPQKCAETLLEEKGKYHDDATCIIIKVNL